MFLSIKNQLLSTVSGVAAKQLVADISRFHRIQASPEYRQAAEMVYETMLAWGLEAQLLSYPANESTQFWGSRMFQEWNGVAGTLRLISPPSEARVLADYRDVRLSLIPRSAPFTGEVEVALPRNSGEEPEDYEGLDVRGKVVIASGQLMRVHRHAVEQRGAVGIIFDGMRTLEPISPEWSLPDAVQYTSFWWWNTERKGFGFALSPRQGQWLRRLVREASEDEPVRLHVRVVSRLYDGAIENVTATIPGQSTDEILLVSHLCHPTPCANDNASGAAATMEVAHALHTLIDTGALVQPQRTIRFLWVPEITGTFAYLASNSDKRPARIVAGLNLDMVGEDQEQCGSVMLFDRPPDSNPGFAIDLLECMRENLFGEGTSFSKRGQFSLFRQATVPFSGGSDHYVFCDPTIGVPMPMLIQWPDKFYHSTADTIDKVSPEMMARSCLLAGTYAYWLATAGPRQVEWLAREMTARFKSRAVGFLQRAVSNLMAEDSTIKPDHSAPTLRRQFDYWVDRQQAAFVSLRRLRADFDPRPWVRAANHFAINEWAAVSTLLSEDEKEPVQDVSLAPFDEHLDWVPQRRLPGPVRLQTTVPYHSSELEDRLYELQKKHQVPTILPTLALYWANGQRDLGEIVSLVELETGLWAPEYIDGYFDILIELGMIHRKNKNG
jgi:aminopeptidase YwaD